MLKVIHARKDLQVARGKTAYVVLAQRHEASNVARVVKKVLKKRRFTPLAFLWLHFKENSKKT